MIKNRELGYQGSPAMKRALLTLIEKREPKETVVIHHYTDVEWRLQLEVERRSDTLGIHFERIIL